LIGGRLEEFFGFYFMPYREDICFLDTKRDLIGNIFVTDKNIYFITTKISNLPENLAFFYGAGGVLFGLIGEVINKLTNKPKTFEKTDDIPLNILTKYIDGSFKIDLSNSSCVKIPIFKKF